MWGIPPLPNLCIGSWDGVVKHPFHIKNFQKKIPKNKGSTWNKKKLKNKFGWYYKIPVSLGCVGWGSEQFHSFRNNNNLNYLIWCLYI